MCVVFVILVEMICFDAMVVLRHFTLLAGRLLPMNRIGSSVLVASAISAIKGERQEPACY